MSSNTNTTINTVAASPAVSATCTPPGSPSPSTIAFIQRLFENEAGPNQDGDELAAGQKSPVNPDGWDFMTDLTGEFDGAKDDADRMSTCSNFITEDEPADGDASVIHQLFASILVSPGVGHSHTPASPGIVAQEAEEDSAADIRALFSPIQFEQPPARRSVDAALYRSIAIEAAAAARAAAFARDLPTRPTEEVYYKVAAEAAATAAAISKTKEAYRKVAAEAAACAAAADLPTRPTEEVYYKVAAEAAASAAGSLDQLLLSREIAFQKGRIHQLIRQEQDVPIGPLSQYDSARVDFAQSNAETEIRYRHEIGLPVGPFTKAQAAELEDIFAAQVRESILRSQVKVPIGPLEKSEAEKLDQLGADAKHERSFRRTTGVSIGPHTRQNAQTASLKIRKGRLQKQFRERIGIPCGPLIKLDQIELDRMMLAAEIESMQSNVEAGPSAPAEPIEASCRELVPCVPAETSETVETSETAEPKTSEQEIYDEEAKWWSNLLSEAADAAVAPVRRPRRRGSK